VKHQKSSSYRLVCNEMGYRGRLRSAG